MLPRLWRLLEPSERRRVLAITPLLALSGLVEVAAVAAVIPFLTLLADPTAASGLPLVGGWLTAVGGDEGLVSLRWAGVMLAAAMVIANVLLALINWWRNRFSWTLNHAFAARLLRHYLSQPYAFVFGRNSAALANRVLYEVGQVMDQGLHAALQIVTNGVAIVGLVVFLVALDPLTALLAFVVVGGLYAGIYQISRRYLQRIGEEAVRVGAARLQAVNEALGGFKDLRVAGREDAAFSRFLGPSKRLGEVYAASAAVSSLPRYALQAVAVGGMVLIATLLAGRGEGFAGTLPLLGAYAFAGLRLMPALQVWFSALTRMRFATGALDAIEGDLRRVADLEPLVSEEVAPLSFVSEVALQGVTYAYPATDEPALRGVSFTVARQRSVAIVGRTGAGKTTLVDVLLGLLAPQAGSVTVDGSPVTSANLRAYRRLFGYVPQAIFLLDDTVARNVAFGVPDDAIDLEAVRRACRQAQIADFVEYELPHGYQTEVGERGIRLSGGERQRIGIARALYSQPQILVFDEATSSLDVHTEAAVLRALRDVVREGTLVTIAHRLDTVRRADHVVVLEHGKVLDEGSPQEVLARYREGLDEVLTDGLGGAASLA